MIATLVKYHSVRQQDSHIMQSRIISLCGSNVSSEAAKWSS